MNDIITEAIVTLAIVIMALFGLTALLRIYDGSSEVNVSVNRGTLDNSITKVNFSETGTYDTGRRMLLDRYETASEIDSYRGAEDITVKLNGSTLDYASLSGYSAVLAAVPNGSYSREYITDADGNVTAVSYRKKT